jgi:hypothetical protein
VRLGIFKKLPDETILSRQVPQFVLSEEQLCIREGVIPSAVYDTLAKDSFVVLLKRSKLPQSKSLAHLLELLYILRGLLLVSYKGKRLGEISAFYPVDLGYEIEVCRVALQILRLHWQRLYGDKTTLETDIAEFATKPINARHMNAV